MAEIYRALIADESRLDQITADVISAHDEGANILVLTTWIDHLNAIAERLRASGKLITVLSGQAKARERREITEQLARHTAGAEPLLIVGTSSFIGEGFDCPALDTLFLAAPDHVQEPTRAVHRARNPSLSLEIHRDGARLPRRTHSRNRVVATQTRTRLHENGLPRPQKAVAIKRIPGPSKPGVVRNQVPGRAVL
jgi:hypothetical protein